MNGEDDMTYFGYELFSDDLYKLLFRFVINFIVLTIIIRGIYYRKTERKDYLFTYYMISTISFMICFALKKLEIDTGMGLGLFAIFGIIRYRTNTIRIKEMTYLFICIGMSVVNAIAGKKISLLELLFINTAVICLVYVMEYLWLLKQESSKIIIYEKIENIKPENYDKLVADLEDRTGLKINKVQVGKVDFLRDVAQIKIFFRGEEQDEYYPEDFAL